MAMNFKLHTYDIQSLMICLIEESARDKKKDVITEAEYERLEKLLTSLNNLCLEKNGYTLSVTVDNGGRD